LREFETSNAGEHVAVRFIAIGSQAKAEAFCGKQGAASLCVGDENKRTYRAMGLENLNLLKLFTDPGLKTRRTENKAAGFSQDWRATRAQDGLQLPGAAIVDATGVLRWIHRGTHPGELPPMREMLDRARDLLVLDAPDAV
jgi:hypothetical protein